MPDDNAPTGVRRHLLVWLAYVRIGFWMLKEANPWRRPYGKPRF